MTRPQFLGIQPRKAHSRASILRDRFGDLLARFGFARRPVSAAEDLAQSKVIRLADVDRHAAELIRKRDALSKRHAAGAKAAQEELTAHVHKVMAGEVRA